MATIWKREDKIIKDQLVVTGVELKEDGSPTGKQFSSTLDITTTNLAGEIMPRVQGQVIKYEASAEAKTDKLALIIAELNAIDGGDFTAYVRGPK